MSGGVGNIGRLVPGLVEQLGDGRQSKVQPDSDGEGNFTEVLSKMIDSVNELQHESAHAQQALLSGEPIELHQVMIKAQEAGVAMDLLLEIRNKLLDAYNEMMRMPV